MEYKYSKRSGALNEVSPASNAAPMPQSQQAPVAQRGRRTLSSSISQEAIEDDDYRETTGTHQMYGGGGALTHSNIGPMTQTLGGQMPHRIPAETHARPAAVAHSGHRGGRKMFYFTVNEGERVRVIHKDGRIEIVDGPKRFWHGGNRVEYMTQYVAHPGEFLIVRFRDGRQEHHAGPKSIWFDAKEHLSIEKEDALPIAAKEAVVVYTRGDDQTVTRRVVHGPAMFVPAPGEILHTFSWHGSHGGHKGYTKVPNALVFQKLWFLPDQMYHDIPDVRTADDAVLTIRLMIFFELVDLPRMLESTHDPIGDFVNAATSDVIDFTGRFDFENFKRHTEKLNELMAYPQLVSRAEQCGYRINKVVYRGYGAPESLQRMHDEAIESRTRLQLERATQEQAQDLEDRKLERDHARAARQRSEREAASAYEIAAREKQRVADLADAQARSTFEREQRSLDEAQRLQASRAVHQEEKARLAALREMGVDLTKLLTQSRADRVIEVRGGQQTHVHLEKDGEQQSD